jgi:hypothetical protein
LTLKEPNKIKNSPTKLLVPGKLILAMVNTKKIITYILSKSNTTKSTDFHQKLYEVIP